MFTRKELTEWTSALRANPEQQMTGRLANIEYTKFCCLGKLCEVRGVERWKPSAGRGHGRGAYLDESNTDEPASFARLPESLALKFTGSRKNDVVGFTQMGMPYLKHCSTAAYANDNGCTWIEIADHFDKYYPCSDETN